MNFGAWIPQFWYDFIGRFVPGLTVIWYLKQCTDRVGITLPLIDNLKTTADKFSISDGFLITLFAYLIGAFLGGISFHTFDKWLHNGWPWEKEKKEEKKKKKKKGGAEI